MTAPKGTQARRILAQINDLLEGKTKKDVSYYQINGRALNKMSADDLLRLKTVYTQKTIDEQGVNPFRQVTLR